VTGTAPATAAVIDEAHLARLVDQLLVVRPSGLEDPLLAAVGSIPDMPDMANWGKATS